MLLKEINFSKPEIIREQENIKQGFEQKNLKFKLNLIECDTVGYNRRIYPKDEMERQVQKLEEKIKKRQLLGELDHPTGDDERTGYIYIKEQSHLIVDLNFNGNILEGVIEILDTPNGRLLRSLIEQDVSVGQSLRQVGTLYPEYDNTYVARDIEIITWDIVSNPSYDITLFTKEQIMENIQYMLKERYRPLFEGKNYKYNKKKIVELIQFKFLNEYNIKDEKTFKQMMEQIEENVERIIKGV